MKIFTQIVVLRVVQWIQMFTKIWSRFVEYLMKSWSIFLVFWSKKYILDDFCWFSLSAVTSCKTCFLIHFFVGCSYRLQICYRPRNFNVFWQLLPAEGLFFGSNWDLSKLQPWLATVVGNRGWQPWLATVVGNPGWNPGLPTWIRMFRKKLYNVMYHQNWLLKGRADPGLIAWNTNCGLPRLAQSTVLLKIAGHLPPYWVSGTPDLGAVWSRAALAIPLRLPRPDPKTPGQDTSKADQTIGEWEHVAEISWFCVFLLDFGDFRSKRSHPKLTLEGQGRSKTDCVEPIQTELRIRAHWESLIIG